MRKLVFAALAAVVALGGTLALAGCNGGSGVLAAASAAPSQAADLTVLDEKAGIAAETAYTAANLLGAKLAQAGLIDKAAFQTADAQAYQALLVVRGAYDTGNSATFGEAVTRLNDAVQRMGALARSTGSTGSN